MLLLLALPPQVRITPPSAGTVIAKYRVTAVPSAAFAAGRRLLGSSKKVTVETASTQATLVLVPGVTYTFSVSSHPAREGLAMDG